MPTGVLPNAHGGIMLLYFFLLYSCRCSCDVLIDTVSIEVEGVFVMKSWMTFSMDTLMLVRGHWLPNG